MITLVVGALVAGVLTTLAPCVLPLLPVIVGGSVAGVAGEPAERGRRDALLRALVITASLGGSIVVFTLLLRASTALIGLPPATWSVVSGSLLVVLGLVALFPDVWDRLSQRLRLQERSSRRLSAARQRAGWTGPVLTGIALGPVFTSCSPFYGYVIVTVLPAEPATGLLLLTAYVVGLCGTLFALAVVGQGLVRRTGWLADPHGWFRRGVGLVFVLVGVIVLAGWDRDVQAWLLEHSPIAPWQLDYGFVPGQQ